MKNIKFIIISAVIVAGGFVAWQYFKREKQRALSYALRSSVGDITDEERAAAKEVGVL